MPERPSDGRPRPPRLAEAILGRLLPERDRAPIMGDLEEEYGRRVRADGVKSARHWYRRHCFRSALPAIGRRAGRRNAARHDGGMTGGERLGVSWLDVKLGLRMLRKRPVMTLAALLSLGVGIPASMVPGHVANVLEAPIPEDDGDRIRSLRYWDQALLRPEAPTYFEFSRWREELPAFGAVAAFRAGDYNLRSPGEQATLVSGAEVTASTFGLLGAVPLVGRTLDLGDESPGSPDVIVVGHDLWRGRLGGDPGVIGTTLEVAGVPHTVVGVMPERFLFPSRQQVWLPLREERPAEPGQGRALQIFGRLADGLSAEDAQAELSAVGTRMATEFPETNARRAVEVVRFGTSEIGLPRGGWNVMNDSMLLRILALVLLLVASGNVAMLVFAGTASRFRELAIRTSLGASRRRIIAQMFVETLILSVSATGLGLFAFQVVADRIRARLVAAETIRFPPYWMEFGVTPEMVTGALLVAVVSASVASVLPALKVTGSKVQESIRRAEAGRSGIRFGGITSALIVADVAIAVGVVGLAVGTVSQIGDALDADERVGIPANEYLAVELSLPSEVSVDSDGLLQPDEFTARLALIQRSLVQRLEAEPRVRRVAVADRLPRQDFNHRRFSIEGETSWLTVEGQAGSSLPPLLPVARVDVDFFDALGQPILEGRAFGQSDLADSAATAIVNTSFVERRLQGRNPIGQRIRFWVGNTAATAQPEGRWYEIVGVVGQLGMNVAAPEQDAGVYLPAAPGEIHPLSFAVRLNGTPETFTPRLREIVSEVDPKAILRPPRVLGEVVQGMWYFYLGTIACLTIIVGILVALAGSGIYAIMSFAVSERTREIGIRRSLGERTHSLALRVGRRSLVQIALGALLGVWPAMRLYRLTQLGYSTPAATYGLEVALAAGVGVALAIGLIACVSPTRRALRIEPSEAVRAEG